MTALKEFNELQDKLYNEYIDRVQNSIVENPNDFWKFAKANQRKAKYPIEMNYNERKSDNPEEIVNLFADHFESLCVNDLK